MENLNIYQKLLKITDKLGVVAKNLIVGAGSYKYKAVSETDILNAVKPLEIKYGIYSFPLSRKIVGSKILETEKKGYTSSKFFVRIETTYRFINTENPEEYVDQVSYGDGVDSLDKSPGKAMTYSDKYSLMKAYKIMTGDDPDQNHSDDNKITKIKETEARFIRVMEKIKNQFKELGLERFFKEDFGDYKDTKRENFEKVRRMAKDLLAEKKTEVKNDWFIKLSSIKYRTSHNPFNYVYPCSVNNLL